MKCIMFAIACSVAAPALATDNFDVAVTGVIRPAACAMTIGNGGRFDVGEIDPSRLRGGSFLNYLAVMDTSFSLQCTSPARWALKGADRRAGTGHVNGTNTFGLGRDGSGNNIGVYFLAVVDAMADEEAVVSTGSMDGGNTWSLAAGDDGQISDGPGNLLGFNTSAEASEGPKAIRSFTATLKLWPVITNAVSLDLSEDIELDGASTIQIYLL